MGCVPKVSVDVHRVSGGVHKEINIMSNTPPKLTPSGVVFAILVICILALIAVPKFREASESPKEERVLARFGASVRDVNLEYNVVTCLHIACSAIFRRFVRVTPFYKNLVKDGVVLYA